MDDLEFDIQMKKLEGGLEILKEKGPFYIEHPITKEKIKVAYEDMKKDLEDMKELVMLSRQKKFRNKDFR
jgi:hypothetical protein